jgi:hypothetical protein
MFKNGMEMPPYLVVIVVIGAVVFFILPGLHLAPLGKVAVTACAVAAAFAMARRVQVMQAARRAAAQVK